jgi:hypothetical protein
MIKASTIAKRKVVKALPLEYVKLEKKLQASLKLIKDANDMIESLQIEIEGHKQEIRELKQHWIYRFWKWLNSFLR